LIAWGETTLIPIVLATLTPKINGPTNSAIALTSKAVRGGKAREEIIVAILLESWIPVRKLATNASPMIAMIMADIEKVFLASGDFNYNVRNNICSFITPVSSVA
jgi:hypothetical protein